MIMNGKSLNFWVLCFHGKHELYGQTTQLVHENTNPKLRRLPVHHHIYIYSRGLVCGMKNLTQCFLEISKGKQQRELVLKCSRIKIQESLSLNREVSQIGDVDVGVNMDV